jgi:hypothetical protein
MLGLLAHVWRHGRSYGGCVVAALGSSGVLASVWLFGMVAAAGDFYPVVAPAIPLAIAMVLVNAINIALGVGALSRASIAFPAGCWALAAAAGIAVAGWMGSNFELFAVLPGAAALGGVGIAASILSVAFKTRVAAWIVVGTTAALYATAGTLLIADAASARRRE